MSTAELIPIGAAGSMDVPFNSGVAKLQEAAGVTINPAEFFKPQLSVAEALERERQLMHIIGSLLKPTTQDRYGNVQFDGADYGVIPGTKNRSLFQTGAEKLALCFGLTVTAYCVEKQEDWTTGFFRYTFKATAAFKGHTIRETTRTCHTREKKYAYVWVTRSAPSPEVQKTMLEKMQARWGSEWVNKQKTKVWQERKDNPDPWSLQFVVEAMAQKRAKVAVVKEALAATGYFSKEIDFEDFREVIDIKPEPATKPDSGKLTDPRRKTLKEMYVELSAKRISTDAVKARAIQVTERADATFDNLTADEVEALIEDASMWLDSLTPAE